MAGNRIIRNVWVVLLMLVFSQKMGMGLYLHNWFHASVQQHTSTGNPESGQEVKFACGCINDFTLPFTTSPELQIPVPPIVVVNTPVAAPAYKLPAVYKYYHSLRAPPVSVA
jgi:hypothetical protein